MATNRALVGFLLALGAGHALAQAFPSKPIQLVIPTAAGSGMDTIARLVAQSVAASLGQPVVPESRPGANGIIGASLVAKAPPDGYRLLIAASATLIASPFIYKSLPFDPRKDFTPICLAVNGIYALVAHSSLPVNSVQELIEHMKRSPKKIAFGSPGIGSSFHLTGEMFKRFHGVDFIHVAYKGAAPMVQDAAAGQVQIAFSNVSNVLPHVASGHLKALVVMDQKPYPALPGVPAISQVYPSMDWIDGWFGFLGPAGLPRPLLTRLNDEIVRALRQPEVHSKLQPVGLQVVASTPEQFEAVYTGGFEKYGNIVSAIGLKPVQ